MKPVLPEPYMLSPIRSIPAKAPLRLYTEEQMLAYASTAVQASEESLMAAMNKLEDAYFKRGLPAFETAADHIQHAAELIASGGEGQR